MNKHAVLHISKRWAALVRGLGHPGGAILLALVVCAIVTTALTGENPIGVYKTMFAGAFGTKRKMWILGQNIAILLVVSLAVTPAFKMRFWNVGGEGQVLIGGLATAALHDFAGRQDPQLAADHHHGLRLHAGRRHLGRHSRYLQGQVEHQ